MSSTEEPLMPKGSDTDGVISDAPNGKPTRKRHRVYGEKICQVCGDKALAHHFGALACETCKAFFRRNAAAREQKVCLFKGDCVVNVKTRRFCPACRLRKCFEMGMQPDLILDDEEKKERKLKLNERKKHKSGQKTSGVEASIKSESYIPVPAWSPGEEGSSNIQSPPCTVTTTFSPNSNQMAITSSEQDQSVSVLEQAWQSASHITSEEIAESKGLVSFSSQQGYYSHDMDTTDTDQLYGLGNGRSYATVRVSEGGSGDIKPGMFSSHSMHTDSDQSATVASLLSQTLPSNLPSLASGPASNEENLHLLNSSQSFLPPVQHLQQPPQQQPHPHASIFPTPEQFTLNTPASQRSNPLQISEQSKLYGLRVFEHVPREQLPSDPYMYWRLSEEERCLLTHLSAAYQDTVLSILKGSPPRDFIPSQYLTMENYLQEFEQEAKNIVTFSKRMEDFRQLRQDEQIALLKASTPQALGIRSCAVFVVERDAYLTSQGYFTPDHCRTIMPNHPFIDPCLDYCRIMKSIVKNDITLYALLHCLVLFDPCDDRIIDRQLINAIRDKYIILLRHYLESVYSYSHSEKYMLALQENLLAYRSMCRDGKPFIKLVFPSIPNKLLAEIMDLDH